MRAPLAALLMLTALPVGPGGAIEVCRENNLGQIACQGTPTHGLDPIDPFPRAGRRTAPPATVPEARTNAFGDTLPAPAETTAGRPRPRICQPDSFGNLRC
ncbi:MAG: hypothetical protein DI556_12630 [Rhodovulum sulfidophilum]|uniref:Uncharacterized protein n=1 Tax=Rhodovulum sulfidophilum TaxID=35806 RepID=A0A2W5PVZ2_RHOSU|nr:MAG: hypothetical protein DI556_12630 [Rhodovulum sulfidophilum]